jgi:hypothetical protein
MIEPEIEKPKRERSKAYPGAPLKECVEYAIQIKKGLGRGSHDRHSLAKAMGFTGVSGAVSPKIAALVHFGLLDRTGDGYELSELSKSITDPLNDSEQKGAITDAFSRPFLYQEIVAKFSTDGSIPNQLATHLYRFHGITDSASAFAAEIFIESGRYAGVLNEQNVIISSEAAVVNIGEAPDPKTEVIVAAEPALGAIESAKTSHSRPIEQVEMAYPDRQRFEFAITRGRAVTIIAPSDLNVKDIKVIRKQIELLELQAELEAEN